MAEEGARGGPDKSSVRSAAVDPAVLAGICEEAGVGLVAYGPDATVEWIDERAETYFGIDGDALARTGRATFLDSYVAPCLDGSTTLSESIPPAEETLDTRTTVHVLAGENRQERWLRVRSQQLTTGPLAGGRLDQFVDVTAQQRVQKLERCEQVVDTSEESVFVVGPDGTVEYANATALEQTDETLASLAGRQIEDLVAARVASEEDADRFERVLEEVLAGETPTSQQGADGTATDWQVDLSTERGTDRYDCSPVTVDGERKVVVRARDVSEQKRKERQYETLVNNFPKGGVTLVDEGMHYQLVGGQIFDSLPEEPADVEGSAVDEIDSGDRDLFVESYQKALGGESFDGQTRVRDRVLTHRTVPVFDDDGSVRAAIGMTQDITDQRERERELRRKSRAIGAAPIGIVMTDPSRADNPVIYANETFLDLSGYDREDVVGRNCRFLQGEATDPERVARIREAIDAERPVSVTLRNYRTDGSEFWNDLEIAPVRDEDGNVVNYIGFQQDVTDRKEREQELEESRNRYRTLVENFPNGAVALVDRELRYTTIGGTPVENAETSASDLIGGTVAEVLPPDLADLLEPRYRAALDGEASTFESSFGDRHYRFRTVPVYDDDGEVFAAMGVSQDVTGQKRREQALAKRERILRELHTATREFYPPESMDEIADFLVEFIENAFEFGYVGVKRFDETEAVLEPAARSVRVDDQDAALGPISPGDNPIWEAYRTGEARLLDGSAAQDLGADLDLAVNQALLAPIGDFGVTVAFTSGEAAFGDVDLDLIEVVAANAESACQRLHSDQVNTEMTDRLSTQRAKVGELRRVIDAIQAIQRRLAESENRDALERGVCEELLETDPVDFAWLGRPRASDTDLAPAAWADEGEGYLDSVATSGREYLVPAQRAADQRDVYTVSNIAELVLDEDWAKEALSVGFRAVVSIPIVYDGILYGVLTAYSRTEGAFGEMYETLFSDIASLVVNYSRVLEHRYGDSQGEYTELEFELTDATYPLHRLATETGARLRFETVVETTGETVRSLVTVEDGSVEAVLDRADSVASIVEGERFGDVEGRQISLTITKPFLAAEVAKHGGQLLALTTGDGTTTLRIALPRNVSQRPLIATLTARYSEIDLVAQRQTTAPDAAKPTSLPDRLTDRQYEILTAAYHGGYYESPRRVTGEDLAESFDISSPAVYNHLQAAHRSLLEGIFEPEIDVPD